MVLQFSCYSTEYSLEKRWVGNKWTNDAKIIIGSFDSNVKNYVSNAGHANYYVAKIYL